MKIQFSAGGVVFKKQGDQNPFFFSAHGVALRHFSELTVVNLGEVGEGNNKHYGIFNAVDIAPEDA